MPSSSTSSSEIDCEVGDRSDTVTLLSDPDLIVENLSPFRRRLLELLEQPDSATGLARRIGTTRQRVNYHLRVLVDAGLVELAEVRQRRGLQEQIMRRSNDVVLVDPAAFAGTRLSRGDAMGVSAVVAAATDQIKRAARTTGAASRRNQRVLAAALGATIRVRTPAALDAMLDELAEVMARYDDADEGLAVHISTTVLPAETTDA